MFRRVSAGAFAALALSLPGLPAAHADPLAGTGENIQAIANLQVSDGLKTELELAGDYAYIADDAGVAIVNISDPLNPTLEGQWKCQGGWGDIDISPDATLAVVANVFGGDNCPFSGSGATLIDISNKKHPKTLAAINTDDQIEYVHTVTLDGHLLYLNPDVYAGYTQRHAHVAVYDVSNPAAPVRKGFVEFPNPLAVAHDTFIDHRPDGKSLMYAASWHATDVF